MPQISTLDLDELVMALRSQDGYDQFWLVDPATGEITFTSRDLEPDLDLDDTDLIRINPLPSWVWYGDMKYRQRELNIGIAPESIAAELRTST